MKKSKRVIALLLSSVLMLGNCFAVSAAEAEASNSDVPVTAAEIPKATELVVGGIFDVKSLEKGITKYLYLNTHPDGAVFTAKSNNENAVIASIDAQDTNAVKLEAVGKGNATVTVTAKVDGLNIINKTFTVQVIDAEYEGTQRIVKNINKDWTFRLKGTASTMPPTETIDIDKILEGQGEKVDVPHCWNNEDGWDGGNDYHKGTGWYVKKESFPSSEYAGKKIYLEFKGASKVSNLYVNGTRVGEHQGGYSIFRFDVTDYIKLDEENTIVLSVNNEVDRLMPLSGDFTVFGGLYRDVNIIATDNIHMDLENYGSTGLYLTQRGAANVTKNTKKEEVFPGGVATLNIKGQVKNSSASEMKASATAKVYDADWKEVASKTFDTVAIKAGVVYDFASDVQISNVNLWEGVKNPYLYNVVFEVKDENGNIVDRERDRFGFRFFCVDEDEGFFLNGESYPLRGVNSHQDRQNQGYAVTTKNRDQDLALMDEIGANTIRFAHYQHDQYVYELSDERGITVWAEIPFVNNISYTNNNENLPEDKDPILKRFNENAKTNMHELVNQGYNRPSIIVWGIHNEQHPIYGGRNNTLLEQLRKIGKDTDPSRLITVATAQAESTALSWQSDVSAWNKYFGLYEAYDVRHFGTWLDQVKKYAKEHDTVNVTDVTTGEVITVPINGKIGMSEYGVGSNIDYHEENPGYDTVTNFNAKQTEEFQAQWHEIYYKAIAKRDWLWGTFIWNMFEFGSDGRSEAGRKGVNNKGLMSYDREIKKDVFYFYKANWSDEPMIHVNSKRFEDRYQDDISAKVYSNLDEVQLFVNGIPTEKQTPVPISKEIPPDLTDTSIPEDDRHQDTTLKTGELGMFSFNITLNHGENTIVAVGTKDGKTYTDTVTWNRALYNVPVMTSKVYAIDETASEISKLAKDTTVATFKENITLGNNSTIKFLNADDTEITYEAAVLKSKMKVEVTAEDGVTKKVYTIISIPGVSSKVYSFNNTDVNNRLLSGIPPKTTIREFMNNITLLYGSTIEFFDGDTKVTDESSEILTGMKVNIISEDGESKLVYTVASTPISQGKPVEAEGSKGNDVKENAVDGKPSTVWNSNYVLKEVSPQTLVVDLGDTYNLTDSSVLWWDHTTSHRTFVYNIKVSDDKENWTTIVSEATSPDQTNGSQWASHNFDQLLSARYVQLEALRATAAQQYATMQVYEFVVNGFRLKSDTYKVNNELKTIGGFAEGTSVSDLLSALSGEGNYKTIKVMNGNTEVTTGNVTKDMKVVIVSANDKPVEYIFKDSSVAEDSPISQGKTVIAVNTEQDVDGQKVPNEDLAQNNRASNINDGNAETRWGGVMNEGRSQSYYPAKVIIDLGGQYNLRKLNVDFFKGTKDFTDRYYQFKVYAGNDKDTLENSDNLVWDMSSNKNASTLETVLKGKNGRYVMLDVVGRISMQDATTEADSPSVYHAASVHEFKIEGYGFAGKTYSINEQNNIISNVPENTLVSQFIEGLGLNGNYSKAKVVLGNAELASDTKILNGCVLRVYDVDNKNYVEYKIVMQDTSNVPISQGKSVIVTETTIDGNKVANEDTVQNNIGAHINDGNSTTRWSGAMNSARTESYYPAELTIQLTEEGNRDDWYYLTGATIDWFNSATKRSYQYRLISNNPVGIPTGWEVDATSNTTQDKTEHWVTGKTNQIKDLRFTVTGTSASGKDKPASAYELKVYGWRLKSGAVNEDNSEITISGNAMKVSEFVELINAKGNCTLIFKDASGKVLGYNDYITAGGKVIVTDVRGNEFDYAVVSSSSNSGDIDGKGDITANDSSILLQFVQGKITLTDEQKAAGDIDGDNEVTANDASLILKKVLELNK